MGFKVSKIFAISLIFSSFLFDINNELNKVNANVKNSPANKNDLDLYHGMGVSFCLLYTSPSPRDLAVSRMPSSA